MSSIKIEVDHRIDEHVKAELLSYSKRSRWENADRIVAALLMILGIFLLATIGMRWWTIIWFVLAPLEYFNLLSIATFVIRYNFKRTPKFYEKNELTFSEEGIHFKTPSIDSNLKWDFYTDIVEDGNLILLMYGNAYSIIPKRCFKSAEDLKEFQALIQRKIAYLNLKK